MARVVRICFERVGPLECCVLQIVSRKFKRFSNNAIPEEPKLSSLSAVG